MPLVPYERDLNLQECTVCFSFVLQLKQLRERTKWHSLDLQSSDSFSLHPF